MHLIWSPGKPPRGCNSSGWLRYERLTAGWRDESTCTSIRVVMPGTSGGNFVQVGCDADSARHVEFELG
ncbi:MAG: hypothetical protein ACO4CZ_20345, partial [Planctomycetota bacterium]